MDTCCGEEAPATAGSKRKGTSDAPPKEDAVDHAQAPKRPRSGARKIDTIEDMVNKLTDKTERMCDMLLTRLNESNAGRNAQYAAVNTQLAAMNKRIEDVERETTQLQQQQHHHHLPGRAGRQQRQHHPHWRRRDARTVASPQHLCMTIMAVSRKSDNRRILPGYVTCCAPYECMGRDVRVCTLVKRGTAFIEHELVLHEDSDIDHVLIEVVPSSGKKKTGLFIAQPMSKAASNPLLICGDFNAPHTQWGYGADSSKGKRLAGLMD
ncbi:hypothetical protein HPB49_002002 [Dermacentor silvarum]|uniref:Uncharacterized protein n=1 Tax=Dermacentor silvarum TaxID=543639 RepID=A0ACB8D267_DERSI|nr:hypothetical protein HPB49_002002 [Dermacentor silvarum]